MVYSLQVEEALSVLGIEMRQNELFAESLVKERVACILNVDRIIGIIVRGEESEAAKRLTFIVV